MIKTNKSYKIRKSPVVRGYLVVMVDFIVK